MKIESKDFGSKIVDSEIILKLISAKDEDFEKTKNIHNSLNRVAGVSRRSIDELPENLRFESHFEGKVTLIQSTKISSRIIIENATLSNGLIFYQCEVGDCLVKSSFINDSILIIDSKIGDFRITLDSNIRNFHIKNSMSGIISISKNCCTGDFLIEDNSSILNFYTGVSSVIGNFHVRNKCEIEGLRLSEGSLIGDVSFEKECKIGDIIIEKGSFAGDFSFIDCTIRKFQSEDILSNFKVVSSNIGNFFLKNCLIPEFEIKQSSKIEANIVGGSINNLEFVDTSISKEAVISFLNTKILKVKMENFAQLGNLYFRKMESLGEPFDWIDINQQYPQLISGSLNHVDDNKNDFIVFKRREYLENFKEKTDLSVFTISQSSLGKTEFSDCDLSGFNFEFNNSKIIDCFITGGTLPGEQSNKEKGDRICVFGETKGSEKWHEQRASFFSQLKSIFQVQGNISRATFFHSKWAEEQRAVYKKRGVSEERISLLLGRISSNHGESWVRAMLFLVFAPMLFYIAYLYFVGRISIYYEFDPKLVFAYFEFLNPIHKPDFIDKDAIYSWAIIFDIFGRIVVSYGIYHFILSFRKFSRK